MSEALKKIVDLEDGDNPSDSVEIFLDGTAVCRGGTLISLQLDTYTVEVVALFPAGAASADTLWKCIQSDSRLTLSACGVSLSSLKLVTFKSSKSKKDLKQRKCKLAFCVLPEPNT